MVNWHGAAGSSCVNSSVRRMAWYVLALAAAPVWWSGPALAQCITERIDNPAPEPGAWTNMVLAADQDLLVVGAPYQWSGGIRGAVQVLRHGAGGWEWEAELGLSDNLPGGCDFATAVAVSGNTVVVGSPCVAPEMPGAVWVFERQAGEWVWTAVLSPEPPEEACGFGASVSVRGDWIAVGAPEDCAEHGGVVILYHRVGTEWVRSQVLGTDQWGERFGSAISMSGGTLVVGAPGHDDGAGTVYIYEHTGWGWGGHELSWWHTRDARCGAAVAVHDENMVIGMPGADKAEVLVRIGAQWQSRATHSPDWSGGTFGAAVAVNDDFALIAQPGADLGTYNLGAVYVDDLRFEGMDTLPQWPCGSGGEYATSVAVGDSWGAIAAPCFSTSGAVDYVLLEGPDCDGNGLIDECELLAGTASDCNGNGVIDLCDVVSGASEDCDGDEVPDECQCYSVDRFSGFISPFGAGFPESFTLPAAPRAVSDVVLEFRAAADLGSEAEWVDVYLNGWSLGRFFVESGSECAEWSNPDLDGIVLRAGDFNWMVSEGRDAVIDMVASDAVDPGLCDRVGVAEAAIGVTIRYVGSGPGDCNGNGVPDSCDIRAGVLLDSDGDGLPDICDFDSTVGDTNCDGAVNAFDIDPFVLALTDPGRYGSRYSTCSLLTADCNGDGVVNTFDIDPFVRLLVGK